MLVGDIEVGGAGWIQFREIGCSKNQVEKYYFDISGGIKKYDAGIVLSLAWDYALGFCVCIYVNNFQNFAILLLTNITVCLSILYLEVWLYYFASGKIDE